MRKSNLLLLVLVNAIWAGQFTAVKFGVRQLGPLTIVVFPMLASAILFGIMIQLERGRGALRTRVFPWSDFPTGARFLLLALGPVVAQLGYSYGIKISLASTASILSIITPVLSAIMAVLLLREHMTRLRWISFLLAMAGAVLILGISPEALKGMALPYLRGNFFLLAGCCGSAFYNVYCKKFLDRFSAMEVLCYSLGTSSIMLLPVAIAREGLPIFHFSQLTWATVMSLLYIGLLSYTLAMVLFLRIIQRIDVIVASLSIYLMPVFGVLIAWVALRERLTLSAVVGGLLVAAATLLVTLFDSARAART